MLIRDRVGKQDIGRVGHGNYMKIFELFNPDKFKDEEFDIKDDLMFFMNNQPEFYRKHYYPSMCKFKSMHEAGKKLSPAAFRPMVEKAYKMYTSEFPLESLDDTINKETCEEICTKVHSTELENIKQGHYDGK